MGVSEPTRGERNIAWIERHCRIPEGKFVGQPVHLTRKQKAWTLRIYPESVTRQQSDCGKLLM